MTTQGKTDSETKSGSGAIDSFRRGLERAADKTVVILGLLISIFLTAVSMLYTEWPIGTLECVHQQPDSVPANLIFMAAVLAAFSLLRYFFHKIESAPGGRAILSKAVRFMTVFGVIYALLFSLMWVATSRVRAYGDGWYICMMAECMELHEYVIVKPLGYLDMFPQQRGLVIIMQIFNRLFGSLNWVPFQYFNALHMPLLVYAGYCCVWHTFQKKEICFYYWILLIGFLPLWMYVPFVYGEISSITFCLVLLWQTLRFCRKGKNSALIFGGLSAGIACQLKLNSLIIVVACCLVLLVFACCRARLKALLMILSLSAGVAAASMAVAGYFEHVSGVKMGGGTPISAYILMGLQDTEAGPGWNTDLDQIVYHEHKGDSKATAEYCNAAIRERLQELWQGGMLDFFYRKVESQWNEPDYNIYFETDGGVLDEETLPWLTGRVYTGTGRAMIRYWMDRWQFVLYASMLSLMLALLFRKNDICTHLLLVAVVGGFLFSILWEAKSRYVLPYVVCMVMLSGGGIWALQDGILKLWAYIKGKIRN